MPLATIVVVLALTIAALLALVALAIVDQRDRAADSRPRREER